MAGVGFDPADNTTALVPVSSINLDYTADLDSVDLKNLGLGLVTTFFNRNATNETTPVNVAMDAYISRLRAAGATIIPINESIYTSSAILAKYDTQRYEYRELMDTYLSRSSLSGSHPSTLSQLYATNSSTTSGQFLVLPSQYEYVTTSLTSSTSNKTYPTIHSRINNLTLSLASTFRQNTLDALIYPEQTNLVVKLASASQSGRNGILAAVTGSPVVTIPIGFSHVTGTALVGVPIGMEILGRPWSEKGLLGIGRTMERLGRVRRAPLWAEEIIEVKKFENLPSVVPDRRNIPSAYPLGVLRV